MTLSLQNRSTFPNNRAAHAHLHAGTLPIGAASYKIVVKTYNLLLSATGVTLIDSLPADPTFVSASSTKARASMTDHASLPDPSPLEPSAV